MREDLAKYKDQVCVRQRETEQTIAALRIELEEKDNIWCRKTEESKHLADRLEDVEKTLQASSGDLEGTKAKLDDFEESTVGGEGHNPSELDVLRRQKTSVDHRLLPKDDCR